MCHLTITDLGGRPDFDFYDEFDLRELRGSVRKADELSVLAVRAKNVNLLHAIGIDNGQPILVLQFAAGESTRNLFVDSCHVDETLASSFENFEYIQNYDGIWSPSQNRIEALIEYGRDTIFNYFIRGTQEPRELVARADSGAVVRVGFPSVDAIALLDTEFEDWVRKLTLSIEGLPLATHDKAENVLDTVGNAFLLQIEPMVGELPHMVTRHRRPWKLFSESEIRLKGTSDTILVYPDPPLRSEPARMYFYARRVPEDLPVVRFLAF